MIYYPPSIHTWIMYLCIYYWPLNIGLLIPFCLFLVNLPTDQNQAPPAASVCLVPAPYPVLSHSCVAFSFSVSLCAYSFILWSSRSKHESPRFYFKFHMVSIKTVSIIHKQPKSRNPVSLEWRMDVHNVVYTNSEIFIHRSTEVLQHGWTLKMNQGENPNTRNTCSDYIDTCCSE